MDKRPRALEEPSEGKDMHVGLPPPEICDVSGLCLVKWRLIKRAGHPWLSSAAPHLLKRCSPHLSCLTSLSYTWAPVLHSPRSCLSWESFHVTQGVHSSSLYKHTVFLHHHRRPRGRQEQDILCPSLSVMNTVEVCDAALSSATVRLFCWERSSSPVCTLRSVLVCCCFFLCCGQSEQKIKSIKTGSKCNIKVVLFWGENI